MLPNESLLDTLRCADYETLVLAKLAGAHLLRLVSKSAEELARRRSFRVSLDRCSVSSFRITFAEVKIGARPEWIHYEVGKQSLAAACRAVAGVIGPHVVVLLNVCGLRWNTLDVGVVFEAAPPLKYAERVVLYGRYGLVSEAFTSNLVAMKELELEFFLDLSRQFNWTFLGRESARELRLVKFKLPGPCESILRSIEELVRYCVTLPRLRSGEALELDFSENDFPSTFGQRIIEVLKDTGCELTFRMRTAIRFGMHPGLLYTPSKRGVDGIRQGLLYASSTSGSVGMLHRLLYTPSKSGAVGMRQGLLYASSESGIVVEVNGDVVTIKSTAVVPRKKPRMSGEVMPSVE